MTTSELTTLFQIPEPLPTGRVAVLDMQKAKLPGVFSPPRGIHLGGERAEMIRTLCDQLDQLRWIVLAERDAEGTVHPGSIASLAFVSSHGWRIVDELEANLTFTVVERVRLSDVAVDHGVRTGAIEVLPWLEPLPHSLDHDLRRAHLTRNGEEARGLLDLVVFTGMTAMAAPNAQDLLEAGFLAAARGAAAQDLGLPLASASDLRNDLTRPTIT